MININHLCKDLTNEDEAEQLEGEGIIVTFDTTNVLSLIEIENLDQEEVARVRKNLGEYRVYIQ